MDRKLKKDSTRIKADVMKDIEGLLEMPTVPYELQRSSVFVKK